MGYKALMSGTGDTCRICGRPLAESELEGDGLETLCSEACLREAILGYWAQQGCAAEVALEEGFARLITVRGVFPFRGAAPRQPALAGDIAD